MLADESLGGEVTSLALCWRLTRGDGLVLGFTSHDQDLVRGGLRYRARPGMTPSAVSLADDFRTDSMEIEGVLDAAAITAFDLDAGRWGGARVELVACDWLDPQAGELRLVRGSIGDVARAFPGPRGAFRAELLSDVARLEQVQPLRVAPMCRAELGDGRCGVDMTTRRIELAAAGGGGTRIALAQAVDRPDDYAGGRVRVLSGALCGIDRRVAAVSGATLLLEEALAEGLTGGTRLWLWEGCDKRMATCAARFANGAAFAGEPHVPGTDALLRYGPA